MSLMSTVVCILVDCTSGVNVFLVYLIYVKVPQKVIISNAQKV